MEEAHAPVAGSSSLRKLLGGYQGNRLLTLYVAAIVGGGLLLLALSGRHTPPVTLAFFLWFLFSVGAELLWLDTPTGEGTDSMASTFNVAVLYLFGNGLSLWIIGLSVLVATRVIQKRDWLRTSFGLGQMVITAYIVGTGFELIAGAAQGIEQFRSFRGVGGFVFACLAYFFVNTFLVAGAVCIERRSRFWSTWRTNYAYKNAILSSAALFALSPLLIISYISIGYPGVLLFFLPLAIVKNQNREYIELQRTTQALISSERMAAKGEMAASVAHEMRNYIAVLLGRLELLMRKVSRKGPEEYERDLQTMKEQIDRLTNLSKGLLDFSHRDLKVTQFDLNALCRGMVDFLQPQNTYDKVKIEFEPDPALGFVEGDAGQIHQVILNLCRNAADAMKDAGIAEGRIWIRTGFEGTGYVRCAVEDNGPGVPLGIRQRIFEPGYTTKDYGHGFGLATTYRIMENHKGRIWVEDRPGGGARFVITWPLGKRARVDGDAKGKADAKTGAEAKSKAA